MFGAGCAEQPPARPPAGAAATEFLDQALRDSPAGRESAWRQTLAGTPGADTSLRLALLQSVPEHSGYDPAAAQRGLRALLARNPPADIAAVARVRLAELRTREQCQNESAELKSESAELKRRLSKVAEIERDLDRKDR